MAQQSSVMNVPFLRSSPTSYALCIQAYLSPGNKPVHKKDLFCILPGHIPPHYEIPNQPVARTDRLFPALQGTHGQGWLFFMRLHPRTNIRRLRCRSDTKPTNNGSGTRCWKPFCHPCNEYNCLFKDYTKIDGMKQLLEAARRENRKKKKPLKLYSSTV